MNTFKKYVYVQLSVGMHRISGRMVPLFLYPGSGQTPDLTSRISGQIPVPVPDIKNSNTGTIYAANWKFSNKNFVKMLPVVI
jgi:hypothetical protein